MNAIQFYDTAKDQAEAEEMLAGLSLQVDFLAGRILKPSPGKPGWRIQALFEDAPNVGWFPDGCRRVIVPCGFLGLNLS